MLTPHPRRESLEGRVALVTGATGAIGGAVARGLARRGVRLVLVGRDADRLAALIRELDGGSPAAEACVLDLADDVAVRSLAGRLTAADDGVDILVHAAGAFDAGSVSSTSVEALDAILRVNFRAPYLLTRSLLPVLRDRKGQVAFIISSVVASPRAETAGYAAAKAALDAFAKAFRQEVNRDGIRVISIYPGRTASAMQEAIHRGEGRPYRPETLLQPEDVAASLIGSMELLRTAEVTDVHLRPFQAPS